jgi:site-specific DNA-methyltransferase (adenine-specific)
MLTPNSVLQGDCVQILKSLPSDCVDLVVTDPPYGGRYKDRVGRTVANDDNPVSVLGAFVDVYRVLKPNSYCISFYGWNKVDAFFRAWIQAGFRPVGHIVWNKPYASRRGFLNSHHEMAYLLVKGEPSKPAQPLNDVQPWKFSGNKLHPTQKSVSVIRPLIESFSRPDAIVLDPFAGSGSTLVAAMVAGRRYLGIELESSYCELMQRRLAHASQLLRDKRVA